MSPQAGCLTAILFLAFAAAFLVPADAAEVAVLRGMVVGVGMRPIGGASVAVVGAPADEPCATTTDADGSFELACTASGTHIVRASVANLPGRSIDGVELAPGREVYLNFVLVPEATASGEAVAVKAEPASGFWSRRVPNPVLGTWMKRTISMRLAAAIGGAVAFFLGILVMFSVGRRLGMEQQSLPAADVADMLLNPALPRAGEHVTPIAVTGARGAAARVSYGADEIAAALAQRRYGLVLVALALAPILFAIASLGLSVAMLAGQELYLLIALLLVPAGFIVTAMIIGVQALRHPGAPI